ncbi:MAG: hypothetical protein IPK80_14810 [Nannocystis sp.]|nr:hypothetical protein [Nannocystis sp.]
MCWRNRLKPGTVYNRKKIIRIYLLPSLSHQRLDEIGEAEIPKLKATYTHHSVSHVNMMIGVLGLMLRVAVEWGVICFAAEDPPAGDHRRDRSPSTTMSPTGG